MQARQALEDERSLGDLFSELARETGELVRHEVALATAEVKRSASDAGKGVAILAVGGLIAFTGLLCFAAAITSLLSMFMPVWGAALIVAAICGITAYLIIKSALTAISRIDPMKNTVETVKEDVKWLKNEMN